MAVSVGVHMMPQVANDGDLKRRCGGHRVRPSESDSAISIGSRDQLALRSRRAKPLNKARALGSLTPDTSASTS